MSKAHLRPLHGVRVLDFSTFTPGPFCTQILADLGATVVKVEPPGGDPQRRTVPQYFRALNRGKMSVVVNLKDLDDRQQALNLASEAHVVVESFRPGVMNRLGMGPANLSAQNAALTYVSIPAYSSNSADHQKRGHDTQVMGISGAYVHADGSIRERPAVPIADLCAGMYAAIGILANLRRQRTEFVHIEVPLLSAALSWMFLRLARERDDGGDQHRTEPASGTFRAGDGNCITLSATEPDAFASLAGLIDHPALHDLLDADYEVRAMQAPLINELIAAYVGKHPRDVLLQRLQERAIPVAHANRPAEVLDDAAVRDHDVISLDPELHARLPIDGIDSARHRRIPDLDEHGSALRSSGWTVRP